MEVLPKDWKRGEKVLAACGGAPSPWTLRRNRILSSTDNGGLLSVGKKERVRGWSCVMWMKRDRGASSKRYRGFWTASHGHKTMGPQRDTLDERKMLADPEMSWRTVRQYWRTVRQDLSASQIIVHNKEKIYLICRVSVS
jgi:hypothetical protein